VKVGDLLRKLEQDGWYLARQPSQYKHPPIPAATTYMVEVPDQGFAEWLDVTLPVREAISA
jgi:hypothetical protein